MSNSDPLVIAIDTSTTSTKAIIVDPNGNVLSQAKQEFPLSNPRTSFYEHDPLDWWNTTNATVGKAISGLKKKQRKRIAAMAMTHQRETFAPFDEDGVPLRSGIIWMDGRAADQIRRYGTPEIHALSGKPADITPALYKLAWVKENQPEILPVCRGHASELVGANCRLVPVNLCP